MVIYHIINAFFSILSAELSLPSVSLQSPSFFSLAVTNALTKMQPRQGKNFLGGNP